jgi:heme exporter protein CcmD
MIEFLDMGGRGWYVWPSFAISAFALGAAVYLSWTRMRRAERMVEILEREKS